MDKEFRKLMEERFSEMKKVGWHDAPAFLDQKEAIIWLDGRLELMQWVLEMMPEEENGL